jgi:hypothetical protein
MQTTCSSASRTREINTIPVLTIATTNPVAAHHMKGADKSAKPTINTGWHKPPSK